MMKSLVFWTLLITLLVMSPSVGAKKCRALAMAGGGSYGAYQAAVYLGLSNILEDEDMSYDVVTGVSAGSLNTLGLSAFEPHEVTEAAEFLFGLWNSVPKENAYQNWPGGILEGLLFKQGIFDLSPGVKWVSEQLGDKVVKRKVSMAALDANTMKQNVFDYNASYTQPDDLIENTFASWSIPAVFEPLKKDGKTIVDGGVTWNMDIGTAVRRCREVVDDDKDIIIDLIACFNHDMFEVDDFSKYGPIDHYMRAREISLFYTSMHDFNSTANFYPDINIRYVIAPTESIAYSLLPLDFSQGAVDLWFDVGAKDAKKAVQLGPGGSMEVLLDYFEKLKNKEKPKLKDLMDSKIAELEN